MSDDLRQLVERHWIHHGLCGQFSWSADLNETGSLQCQAAPILQELFGGEGDGGIVWSGFSFNLWAFGKEPEIEIESVEGESLSRSRNDGPLIQITGRFNGASFVLTIHMEPRPDSVPIEVVDTLTDSLREIEEKQDD